MKDSENREGGRGGEREKERRGEREREREKEEQKKKRRVSMQGKGKRQEEKKGGKQKLVVSLLLFGNGVAGLPQLAKGPGREREVRCEGRGRR